MFSSLIAVGSLVLAVALVPVAGLALVTLVLFGLAALAIVGVIISLGERNVEQRNPSMDPRSWRAQDVER